MPSDFFTTLFGGPSPPARAQAQADSRTPQEAQDAAGAPPLPDPPGAAHDALGEALDALHPPLHAIEHQLEQVTALLQALQPRRSITETLYLDATNGQIINTRGREYVGIRSSISTPAILFQRTTGQTAPITISANYLYFAGSDGVRVFAAASGNVGNYELLYTDQIGGAVPN